jgi:hypothetical protein
MSRAGSLSRFIQIRYLVWAAALAFAVAIAQVLYMLAGFGRLGPREGVDAAMEFIGAMGIGIASQLGLGLAPLVRSRGHWLRAGATVLMIPALVFGIAAYQTLLGPVAAQSAQPLDRPVMFLYLSIVPVHVAVVLWMWRAPHVGEHFSKDSGEAN